MSAQHSRVPKFGNWENGNVPYTTYFENARREKASGVRMNPNDPEENPEAFMNVRGAPESEGNERASKPPRHLNSEKSTPAENRHIEGHTRRNVHRRTPSDQKSGSHKSISSESGSEITNSDNSLLQSNNRRLKSDRNKNLVEKSKSSSAGSIRMKSGNHQSDATHHRAASIPKFGEWDENDPKSGEGYTVIFNKVKEEKHVVSSTISAVPSQPSYYPNEQKKHGCSSSLGSKICCCCRLFSRGSN